MFGCIRQTSFSIGILAITSLTAIDANSAAISCRCSGNIHVNVPTV